MLSVENIRSYTTIKYPLQVFQTIDSTNNYAKDLIKKGAENGTMIVANEQTAGRGRQGHRFFSPKDAGLYLSIILKPNKQIEQVTSVTLAAAVAAVQAIQETTSVDTGIKWVNDIYIGHKKVAGILTEAVTTDQYPAIVMGIGVNCVTSEWPEDIKDKAGAINASFDRNELAANIWKDFLSWSDRLDTPDLIDEYRKHSILINKQVEYSLNNVTYTGTVTTINNQGNLVIMNPDGKQVILNSGEVTITKW